MGDIFSNAVFAEGLAPHTHLITVLYDFIPLETQGKEWGGTESWYYKFYLEYINRLSEFSLLLCISEYTAQKPGTILIKIISWPLEQILTPCSV